ncbi:hypothetical protein MYSTI_00090 [Myxococcus stipitatus DSM 14675]|uniref:Uncharacterized protein n=1 Tax=Myxococcus stipitatus (strain DSM 14675 / JCM 12634 / Mx s8) TaxID=1278073 RepID=L7U4N3_MYXSD|nr:hypothetical protein [Myxococcus stipitatus]AGC41449.1 hypothetical protein MYSTI_00090 [Myxococcus stipitatus DSM 14675]
MPTRYFRLTEAVEAGDWSLGDLLDEKGRELEDPSRFTSGQPVAASGPLKLRVREQGRRRDFTLAGASGIPVLHSKMSNCFAEFAAEETQLLSVAVKGGSGEYHVLVATQRVACSSEMQVGNVATSGDTRGVGGMRIDPGKVGGLLVFRAAGGADALIISEHLKSVLERARLRGVAYEEV